MRIGAVTLSAQYVAHSISFSVVRDCLVWQTSRLTFRAAFSSCSGSSASWRPRALQTCMHSRPLTFATFYRSSEESCGVCAWRPIMGAERRSYQRYGWAIAARVCGMSSNMRNRLQHWLPDAKPVFGVWRIRCEVSASHRVLTARSFKFSTPPLDRTSDAHQSHSHTHTHTRFSLRRRAALLSAK